MMFLSLFQGLKKYQFLLHCRWRQHQVKEVRSCWSRPCSPRRTLTCLLLLVYIASLSCTTTSKSLMNHESLPCSTYDYNTSTQSSNYRGCPKPSLLFSPLAYYPANLPPWQSLVSFWALNMFSLILFHLLPPWCCSQWGRPSSAWRWGWSWRQSRNSRRSSSCPQLSSPRLRENYEADEQRRRKMPIRKMYEIYTKPEAGRKLTKMHSLLVEKMRMENLKTYSGPPP